MIDAVGSCKWPYNHSWHAMMTNWTIDNKADYILSYEDLLNDTRGNVDAILASLGISVEEDRIKKSIHDQSFDVKKKYVQRHGDKLPWGIDVQKSLLRKGQSGDWKNHFSKEQARRADEYFGDWLLCLGYEDSPDWWKEL